MFKALLNSVVAMINSERELKLTLFLEKNINNGQLSNNANNKNFVRLMILLHNCEQSTGGMRIINFLTEPKQNDPKQTYITNGHILIDSTSKFHMERFCKLHRFWKANLLGNYDIDSVWKFWRGFDFQNRQNINECPKWIFICCFDVESTSNRRNFCTCCFHSVIF